MLNVRDATLKQMMANEVTTEKRQRETDEHFSIEHALSSSKCLGVLIQEIQNLIKIIGLDLNRESWPHTSHSHLASLEPGRYDSELKGLRYGSIMIMADQASRKASLSESWILKVGQDSDGSHIKGLLPVGCSRVIQGQRQLMVAVTSQD